MRTKVLLLSFLLPISGVLAANAGTNGWYNVNDFGAKGDGQTVNTAAINAAIDEAARHGGGTIFFPAGNYLSFSIHLQNNISLYLDQGACLIEAKEGDGGGYDDPEPNTPFDAYQDFGHNHWKNSLIWGIGLQDISIRGEGLIWGRDLTHTNRALKGAGTKPSASNCVATSPSKTFPYCMAGILASWPPGLII